jgi:hypothetical protein
MLKLFERHFKNFIWYLGRQFLAKILNHRQYTALPSELPAMYKLNPVLNVGTEGIDLLYPETRKKQTK